MANKKMVCPFSKESCRECPVYRGRHAYLCFYGRHRNNVESFNTEPRDPSIAKKWEMPLLLTPSPTWLILNDFAERREQ